MWKLVHVSVSDQYLTLPEAYMKANFVLFSGSTVQELLSSLLMYHVRCPRMSCFSIMSIASPFCFRCLHGDACGVNTYTPRIITAGPNSKFNVVSLVKVDCARMKEQ